MVVHRSRDRVRTRSEKPPSASVRHSCVIQPAFRRQSKDRSVAGSPVPIFSSPKMVERYDLAAVTAPVPRRSAHPAMPYRLLKLAKVYR